MEQNEQSSELAKIEVLPPSAIEAVERAQVDVQIATAHRFPRSLEQFKKRATTMATLDEDTAESCIFSRPVGGGKVVEGASIRLAEIVAASYGNLRVGSRIIEQTDRYVRCEGWAQDLESNYAAKSEVIESTVDKHGNPYAERMRIVAAKAALAKATRDAIFRVVPRALCKTVIDAARGVMNGDGASIEKRRLKIQNWLKAIKVEDHRVFSVLNVKGWSDVGVEQMELLTGLKTGIHDGELTVEEAFPFSAKPAQTDTPLAPVESTTTTPLPAGKSAYDLLMEKLAKDNVPEEHVVAYLKNIHFFKAKGVFELLQLKPAQHTEILNAWDTMLPEIKKIAESQKS